MKMGGAFESLPPMPKPVLYLIMCVSGTGPLWFIQMLWAFSVLLVIFRKIDKDRLWSFCGRGEHGCACPVCVNYLGCGKHRKCSVHNSVPIRDLRHRIFYRIFCFVSRRSDETAEKFRMPLGAAAIILGTAFVIVYWGAPYAEHTVLDTPLCNFYAWLAVLAILAFMKRHGNIENAFTRFMNKMAWGLYLFHYVPLSVCAFYLYGVNIPPFFKYVLTAIAAFSGGILLYEISSRIPVLRRVVCGMILKNGRTTRGKYDLRGYAVVYKNQPIQKLCGIL